MIRTALVTWGLALLAAAASGEDLTDKTYVEWRDRIRPKKEERAIETIAWHATFWDGVIAAQKEDKPILLFAMNGHPLACT